MGLAALIAGACGDPGPPTLQLAPLGAHEAHVGQAWVWPLANLAPAGQDLTWTLTRGPDGMGLLQDAEGARLVWFADAFDLGPSKPGAPRTAGPAQTVQVRARRADGAIGTSEGSVRAVPVSLAAGIDVAETLWLPLATRRVGRWPVQTATTSLRDMPVTLGPDAPPGAELLQQGPGRYVLRYRPDREDIARHEQVPLTVYAPDSLAPVATRQVTVRLLGAPAASPCAGEAPAVRAELLPSSGPAGARLRIRALDDRAGPLVYRVQGAERASAAGPQTLAAGPLPDQGATVQLPLPATGALWQIRVDVRDRDDPLLSACDRLGHWPDQGWALVGGAGPCPDETDATGAHPLWLATGQGLDRRLCPGREDVVSLKQPAGQPLALVTASPRGWPGHTAQVWQGGQLRCDGGGARATCWLPATPQPVEVRIILTGQEATSVHVEARATEQECRIGPGQPQSQWTFSDGLAQTVTLCPGQRHQALVKLPQPGQLWLRWSHAQGRVGVQVRRSGALVATWRDLGGHIRAHLWGEGGEVLELLTDNRSDRTLTTVVEAIEPPQSISASAWLPSLQPWHARLWPGGQAVFGLATNPAGAALAVAAPEPPPGFVLEAVAPGGLAPLTSPWPSVGEAAVATAGPPWQVSASAGAPSTPALRVGHNAPGPWTVRLHPLPGEATGCDPDRYDALNQGAVPFELLAPRGQASVVADLHLCAGASDQYRIEVAADDLIEVAVSADSAPPPLTIKGPGGRQCMGDPPGPWESGWATTADLPPQRVLATCWMEQSGQALVTVGPAHGPLRYDLALRRR